MDQDCSHPPLLTVGWRRGGQVGLGVVVVAGGEVVLVINNPNSANRFMWKSFCDSTGQGMRWLTHD